MTRMNRHIAPPQEASRENEDGTSENGELFYVVEVVSSGRLRATYEYNIYHWLESDSWEADVISPHGWHDLDEDEVARIIDAFHIKEGS